MVLIIISPWATAAEIYIFSGLLNLFSFSTVWRIYCKLFSERQLKYLLGDWGIVTREVCGGKSRLLDSLDPMDSFAAGFIFILLHTKRAQLDILLPPLSIFV